ncbi:hypothetical protein WCLP8_5220014 [uncultured Gammaproteobacteria bacterium]
MNARRHDRARIRGAGADSAQALIEEILEFGPLTLEAGGGAVGDVVGNGFDVELLGQHAGSADRETFHGSTLLWLGSDPVRLAPGPTC